MTLTQTDTPVTNFDEELAFEATMPRELVHKQSVHEVLLTDARQIDEDTYVCAGQLPRTHSFYSDGFYNDGVSSRYDTMLPMELKRQGGVLIAHRWQGVPQGYRFVFLGIDLTVQHPDALAVGGAPANVVMIMRTTDRQHRDGALTGYTMDTEFTVDGVDACTATGSVMFLPRPVYEAMRRKQREAQGLPTDPPERSAGRRFPVAPELLGRHNESNVVLSGLSRQEASDSYEANVVVDDRHPCLFDHRLDHVPGMLLLEAHRQIAVAAAADRLGVSPSRLVVTQTSSTFESFAELDLQVMCDATVAAGASTDEAVVTTRLLQRDAPLSDGRFTFAIAE
jgi:hypothetical protein